MSEKKPRGRPSKKTKKLINEIISRIANGEALIAICRDSVMPSTETFFKWMRDDEDLLDMYARAKEATAYIYAEQIIEIADTAKNRVEVEKARIQVDARKWLAAKLLPKKYGDKLNLEHSGEIEIKKVTVEIIKPKE